MSFWEKVRDHDEILLENLEVSCVVGIYPDEKIHPQSLLLNLRLFLDTRQAVQANSLRYSVDYAAIAGEIRFILQHARYKLVETAAEALCHYLMAPVPADFCRSPIAGVDLTIRKMDALPGTTIAGVRVKRHVDEMHYHRETTLIGELEVLHQHPDCCLYRLGLAPQESTPQYTHEGEAVAEMPLAQGVLLGTENLAAGESRSFNAGCVRAYHNPTAQHKTLLCVAPGSLPRVKEQPSETIAVWEKSQSYYPGIDTNLTHSLFS